MKTIEEAAKEFESTNGERIWNENENSGQILCIESFKSGVEFAQRWIQVEEELPKVMVQILVKSEKRGIDLFKPRDNGDIKWVCETFTHWRPITIK